MDFKKFFLFFVFFPLLFSATAFAQVCFDPQTEEMIELSHTTGSGVYYLAVNKDFGFELTDHGKTTYEKGTTKLIFSPSSFVTKNTSNLTSFVNAALSEFNDTTRYSKDTALTETTVGEYKAFYLEYTESKLSEKGRVTLIIGDVFDDRTKTYTINMRAKTQRFEEEKTEYLKLLQTFSLNPFDECEAGEPTPPPEGPAPPPDMQPSDSPDEPDESSDQTTPDVPNTNFTDSNPNQGSQKQAQNPEFKIFGFDGVLVIAGIVLLLLLLGIGFVILVVIGVIIYFFFIKKR